MLPKEYRLKKKSAFTATYKSGKSFHRNGITMFCGKKKQDMLPCKAGFVVSKKIHKRAVKRNRIKRLLRESFRSFIPINGQNFFFVFIPKVKEDYSLEEIKSNMSYLLKKGGFIG